MKNDFSFKHSESGHEPRSCLYPETGPGTVAAAAAPPPPDLDPANLVSPARADNNNTVGTSSKQHPCLSCGACCAHFRVAFYWREAEPDGIWKVPVKLTVDLDSTYRCMKGTEVKHGNNCIALTGRIGRDAHCSIYQNRPTPCRNFMASYEDGKHNPRCDEARKHHGLRPLRRDDYEGVELPSSENKPSQIEK